MSRLQWIKSSKSNGTGGNNCIEVARGAATGDIYMRNSRFPEGRVLRFTPAEWTAFVMGVEAGEFKDL